MQARVCAGTLFAIVIGRGSESRMNIVDDFENALHGSANRLLQREELSRLSEASFVAVGEKDLPLLSVDTAVKQIAR